jgi:ankyrin repeat protein
MDSRPFNPFRLSFRIKDRRNPDLPTSISQADRSGSTQVKTIEEEIFKTIERLEVEKAENLLQTHPDLDINWQNENFSSYSMLHMACRLNLPTVVSRLLRYPGINVNLREEEGRTAFSASCKYGSLDAVKLLLLDNRVDMNIPINRGYPPLTSAIYWGHPEIVKHILASGREVDHAKKSKNNFAHSFFDEDGLLEVFNLLDAYIKNPSATSKELRKKLNYADPNPVRVLLLVILFCDGYFTIDSSGRDPKMVQFFNLMQKLTYDAQMVVCNRLYSNGANFISSSRINQILGVMVQEGTLEISN